MYKLNKFFSFLLFFKVRSVPIDAEWSGVLELFGALGVSASRSSGKNRLRG